MHAEALDFEGYFNERLAEAERRLSEVATLYGADGNGPYIVQKGASAEYERRLGERQQIECERDEERARRTTTGTDGYHTLRFCELRPDDVIGKRARVIIARDQVARELAEIEAQLSPGEMVQAGTPAADYLAHRERVATLRERLDTKGAAV